jgi:hypothetical protein
LIKDCFVVENGVINIYMVFLGFVLVKISWSLGLIEWLFKSETEYVKWNQNISAEIYPENPKRTEI